MCLSESKAHVLQEKYTSHWFFVAHDGCHESDCAPLELVMGHRQTVILGVAIFEVLDTIRLVGKPGDEGWRGTHKVWVCAKTLWSSSRMAWGTGRNRDNSIFLQAYLGFGGLDMRPNAGPRAIESRSLSQMWF